MAEVHTMKCECCGGILECKGGDIWYCNNCGTSVLVDAHRPQEVKVELSVPSPKCLVIKNGKMKESFDFISEATILFEFDRRATKADKFPTNMVVTTDGVRQSVYKGFSADFTGFVKIGQYNSVCYLNCKCSKPVRKGGSDVRSEIMVDKEQYTLEKITFEVQSLF